MPPGRAPIAAAAAPKPYHPGSITRAWDQLKTQGMALRSSIRSDADLEGGRLPMLSWAISGRGVDWRK